MFQELSKLKNCTELYVPLGGIGDALLFEPVAREIYRRTNKKVLISHKAKSLFLNNPYVSIIDGFYDSQFDVNKIMLLKKHGIELIYPCYWNYRFKQDFGHVLAYPKQHIITETASKCGLSGEIDIVPRIYLTDEEKKFGNFRTNSDQKQIVIMSTAKDAIKQWNGWQQVAEHFLKKHVVVQIGDDRDLALVGPLDKRGIPLRKAASILYNSDLYIGQVGGLMHMARAVNVPAVIAYPCGEPIYFAVYQGNSYIFPNPSCDKCATNQVDYYYEGCSEKDFFTKNILCKNVIFEAEKKLQNSSKMPVQEIKPILKTLYRGGIEEYCLRMSCTTYNSKNINITRISLFKILPFLKIISNYDSITKKKEYIILLFHFIPCKIVVDTKRKTIVVVICNFIKLFGFKIK